jgi:hypothetical protein
MRPGLFIALAVAALALSAGGALAAPSANHASPGVRYVFSFKTGLGAARIGGKTSGFLTAFRGADRLPDVGAGDVCFGLAYAVSPGAKKARKADLELYCGDEAEITEAHLGSSAFCSTGGTCVGSPGSMQKFVAELKRAATVIPNTECIDGTSGCTSVAAILGRTQVSIRSSNCPRFKSLAAIGPGCVAGDVLIYLEA